MTADQVGSRARINAPLFGQLIASTKRGARRLARRRRERDAKMDTRSSRVMFAWAVAALAPWLAAGCACTKDGEHLVLDSLHHREIQPLTVMVTGLVREP